MTPLQRHRRNSTAAFAALAVCAVIAVVAAFAAGARVGTGFGILSVVHLTEACDER